MALARVQQAGLQGESAIVEGIPFQMIIETAESRDIDLIVMGTHGRTGLTHVLMSGLSQCSHCPLCPATHPHCPLAARLAPLVERWKETSSDAPMRMTVETKERTVIRDTVAQRTSI